jgi:hypothetical protein
MSYENDRVGATTARRRPRHDEGQERSLWKWLLPLLALLAVLAVAVLLLLGEDGDSDTEGGFDADVPESDVDVEAPDVDVEARDVDVDGGSVHMKEGTREPWPVGRRRRGANASDN